MKVFTLIFCLLFFSFSLLAQTSEEILATANNQNYTSKDLAPNTRESYEKLPQIISNLRTELLGQQVADILLKNEAAAQKVSVESLISTEMKRRVADPTDAQIKAVYDANRQTIGDKALADVRPQIIAYLRREPEQKALMDYITSLKAKYIVVFGRDVNAKLMPTDVLATVSGKSITAQEFEEKAKPTIYDTRMEVYDQAEDELEQMIYSSLIATEAKSLGMPPENYIGREITDKLKDFSNEERAQLEMNLQKRLFQKYNAKILMKEPAPYVQNISVGTAPSRGKVDAPVTVVMFSDFQCPACSATHPVLQKVLAEYGDKVHFVVRDFPLTQIHNNSFVAAQAAAAANAQGKFFEYIEILYKNQESLDKDSLKKFAGQIGLNQQQFNTDLDSGKFADYVKKDMQDGTSYGISGTPTIYVNGVKVRELSAKAFRDAIDRALNRASGTTAAATR